MKIELIQSKFGLGEINSEIYTATMSELNSRLTEIRRDLEDAGKNLSNMMNYINQTIEISCKLGSLWRDSDFSNRQKIQNLVYPGGIYFDKKNDDYRTENENEVFKIFRRFLRFSADLQQVAKVEKKKRQPILLVCRLLSE